jgi:membrane protein DedA with SNARE-associated domain
VGDGRPYTLAAVALLDQFLEEFTYAGIFLSLFAAGLGVPLPEEVPILTAGVLAHEGVVRWWLALPVCFAGVLLGDVALYWAGRHWGERVLAWRPVRWFLTTERERTLTEAYHRHGVKIVFTARHVMGLRAAAFLTAGIVGIPFPRFLAADTLAALLGVPVGFGLAFFFTDQLAQIMADVRRAERWALLLLFLAVAVWIAVAAWRHGTNLEREAARAARDAASDRH